MTDKCPKCGVVMADQRDDADDVVCTLTGGVECLRRQLAALKAAIDRSGMDISMCPRCGLPVVCVPEGMPVECDPCYEAAQAAEETT